MVDQAESELLAWISSTIIDKSKHKLPQESPDVYCYRHPTGDIMLRISERLLFSGDVGKRNGRQ